MTKYIIQIVLLKRVKNFKKCFSAITVIARSIARRIEIPLEKNRSLCEIVVRSCQYEMYRTVVVSYTLRGTSRIAVAIHAGTIYFYLGRKSLVVMEIYRGLNIDINDADKVEWAIRA